MPKYLIGEIKIKYTVNNKVSPVTLNKHLTSMQILKLKNQKGFITCNFFSFSKSAWH